MQKAVIEPGEQVRVISGSRQWVGKSGVVVDFKPYGDGGKWRWVRVKIDGRTLLFAETEVVRV